jgi:hypothetical protein
VAASFSYDPATDIGRLRRLLGDTRAESALWTDEELQASINAQGTVEGAVWECATQALAESIRMSASKTEGNERSTRSVDTTRRPAYWEGMVARFEPHARTAMPTIGVRVGSIPTLDGVNVRAIPRGVSG